MSWMHRLNYHIKKAAEREEPDSPDYTPESDQETLELCDRYDPDASESVKAEAFQQIVAGFVYTFDDIEEPTYELAGEFGIPPNLFIRYAQGTSAPLDTVKDYVVEFIQETLEQHV